MRRPVVDLVGQKFGYLTVLELYSEDYIRNDGRKIKQWRCICDCGNEVIAKTSYLKDSDCNPSCGCKLRADSMIGKTFGDLTVYAEYHGRNNRIRCRCHCKCGGQRDACKYDLLNGKITHCGCKPIERSARTKPLTGQRFNALTVIGERPERRITKGGNNKYLWLCKCDCGEELWVEAQALKKGKKQSCGCVGAKKHGISIDEYRNRYNNLLDSAGKALDLTNMRFGKLTALYVDTEATTKARKWMCLCDCGAFTSVSTANLTNGHTQSCGCIDSVGEMKIVQVLNEYNILYKKEQTFKDCRDAHPLPFDFGLYGADGQLKGLIEYDGLQHFQKVRFNGMTEERATEAYEIGIHHDMMKNQYCIENHIPLLRIKYSERDKLRNLVLGFLQTIGCWEG